MSDLKITDLHVQAEEKEILEDLLVAAHADAKKKTEAVMQDKMKKAVLFGC